jgi:hypothetical protein
MSLTNANKETSVVIDSKDTQNGSDVEDTQTTGESVEEVKEERKSPRKIDILKADVFHSNPESVNNPPWRNLEPEDRIEKMNEYFEREFNHSNTVKTISKETEEIITELLSNNQLRLKKEIEYDRVNQRVVKLHVIAQEQHTHKYVYRPDSTSQKEKSRKAARSMLFRKKR